MDRYDALDSLKSRLRNLSSELHLLKGDFEDAEYDAVEQAGDRVDEAILLLKRAVSI